MRTIAQISDLHFGRHNLDVMNDLIASVDDTRSDLVVVSGDFTQRARHAEFAEARRFLDRIAVPKLVVPGNHDMPLYNLFGRYLKPFRKYDQYIAPLDQPASFFHDEELAVLGLNTARRFARKNGRLSLEQVAKIRRVFGSVPFGIFKVLVTHHPLGTPDGEATRELAGRSRIGLETIADAGVHLLLSGHHHRAVSGVMTEIRSGGSILIVHAGTAISTRTRGVGRNSYNLIRITDKQVSVQVMEWEGIGFKEGKLASYVFAEARWNGNKI